MIYSLKAGIVRRLFYVKREIGILLGSRIIQFFLLMPFMYMSYKLGRQIYIEYQSYRYPGYYI